MSFSRWLLMFVVPLLAAGCGAVQMDAATYANRGIDYVEKGQHDQAIADFTKALELEPTFALAYVARGGAYNRKDQLDEAIADFTKALELDPKLALAYVNRGIAYAKKGEYDQAISDFNKTLAIEPRNEDALLMRAASYYFKKNYDKAWEDVHKAQDLGFSIDPGFLKALREASAQIPPSHERAAREIVRIYQFSPDEIDALAELVVATQPEKKQFRLAYWLWARELSTSPEMEDLLARIWVKHFSEREIEELIDFYRTPFGAKFRRFRSHLLRQLVKAVPVREAFERWDGASPPPPEIRDIFFNFLRDFSTEEMRELKRHLDSPAVRKGAELVPLLIAETTRGMERLTVTPPHSRRSEELLGLKAISDPTRRLHLPGLSVLPPKGEAWFLRLEQTGRDIDIAFIKRLPHVPADVLRVYTAVFVFDLGERRFDTPAAFLEHFKSEFEGRAGQMITERQKLIGYTATLDDSLGATCARYTRRTEFAHESRFLATRGFYCLHPHWPQYAINLAYSQMYPKGQEPLALDAEAETFLKSPVFTSTRPVVP